jgi:hypothetical protein
MASKTKTTDNIRANRDAKKSKLRQRKVKKALVKKKASKKQITL